MKIRRFRLRGAPRFPVVVEPPPTDAMHTDEAATTTLAGGHNVIVAEDEHSFEYQRAKMNRVIGWLFGCQIPERKKEAPWSPNPVSIAEF